MLCGVFVIVKFHIEKQKDGLFLPMIEFLKLIAVIDISHYNISKTKSFQWNTTFRETDTPFSNINKDKSGAEIMNFH